MSKVLVVSKGYTVEVTSWENDGDNYATNKKTYKTKEQSLVVLDICKNVFASHNNGGGGIGNMSCGESTTPIINEYLGKNPNVTKVLCEIFEDDGDDTDVGSDLVDEIKYELMGSSEYYASRVFESGTIYYSPEDVYLERIKD